MPFQFNPYEDRFSGSIASLLARRGDIGAQAAMTIGNARANAAAASGQAWAGALNNIGQTFAALPGQIEGQKRIALQDELLRGRVADEQKMRAGEGAVDTMMRGDQLPAGAVGPRQDNFLGADGLYDIPKMTAALGKSGIGSKAPELLKGAEAINDSILKHQDLAAKTAQAHAVALGDAAAGAMKLIDGFGMPVIGAMDFISQPLIASKTITQQEYAQLRQQVESLPPEQQKAVLTSLMDRAAQLSPTKTVAEGAIETDRYRRTVATGGAKPPTAASLALTAAGGDEGEALKLLHPDKPDTAAQDDQRYEKIVAAKELKQPVTAADAAFVMAYEKRKTLGVDKSAAAAAERADKAGERRDAILTRTENFQEAQAGRKEISDKVEAPYLKARQKVETLKDVVDSAQHGNMSAAAVQNLMGVLGVVTVEGVQRINTTELRAFGAQGGLLQRIQGWIGQKLVGQPLAPSVQKDLKELADVLGKGSRDMYETQFRSIKQRYGPGMANERLLPPSGAPDEGTEGTINGVPVVFAYDNAKDKWGWKKK